MFLFLESLVGYQKSAESISTGHFQHKGGNHTFEKNDIEIQAFPEHWRPAFLTHGCAPYINHHTSMWGPRAPRKILKSSWGLCRDCMIPYSQKGYTLPSSP